MKPSELMSFAFSVTARQNPAAHAAAVLQLPDVLNLFWDGTFCHQGQIPNCCYMEYFPGLLAPF